VLLNARFLRPQAARERKVAKPAIADVSRKLQSDLASRYAMKAGKRQADKDRRSL